MDALWNFIKDFGKWFGLIFIGLALLGGLINGVVWMTRDFWTGFYGMFETWFLGLWFGIVIIMLSMVVDAVKKD